MGKRENFGWIGNELHEVVLVPDRGRRHDGWPAGMGADTVRSAFGIELHSSRRLDHRD